MSTSAGQLQTQQSVRGRNVIVFLLIVFIAFAGLDFFFLARYNDYDREFIDRSNDLQVLSQEIAKFSNEAAQGNIEAFDQLRATQQQIQNHISALGQGNEDSGMPGVMQVSWLGGAREEYVGLRNLWAGSNDSAGMSGNVQAILDRQSLVVDIADTEASFSSDIQTLQSRMDEVLRALMEAGAPAAQIYVGARQLTLADRMLRSVGEIVQGGIGAATAADRFGRDAALFGKVLRALLNGNEEMGVEAIEDQTALEPLGEVFTLFEEVREDVDKILEAAPEVFTVSDAADAIFQDSELLLENSETLANAYSQAAQARPFPNVWFGLAAGGAALFFLIVLFALNIYAERKRARATQDVNQRNQEAILRLLDEMGSLAEGDLTVQATVTEDITGAIADSVNFAVEALRNLVTTINDTAVRVASAAEETQATAAQLAEASEHQAQQITSASTAINEMAVSIDDVSNNSSESADVAQKSVHIAGKGADTVRRTIEGMDNIREQIQETSKRIKRLGESSQEIGDIVELINDIAEQTNILALNAAIQAATAGEAGRGFAVVADEVQRLAERSTNATKQIEALVKTIQTDTNEAVISMEQTTSEVVNGAKLAEDAGEALGEIENVSTHLAELIQNISEASRQQSEAASNISGTMNVIQEITTQTSLGTNQTAESIGNLAQLAADLRRSVADFKLPEE